MKINQSIPIVKRHISTIKFLVLWIFLSVTEVMSQVVYTDPIFPKETDSVTIFYNAKLGNAALVGASQVFAHTGVITTLSSSSVDWRHVVGNWGTNDSRVKMNSLGNDLWSFRIHMKSFYALGGAFANGESILRMAFVFRDQAGNKVGRASNGGDIFHDVYSANSGLLVKIVQPELRTTIGSSSTLFGVAAYTSKSSDIDIILDGSVYRSVTSKDSIQGQFKGLSVGNHQIVVRAVASTETKSDTVSFIVNPSVVQSSLPSGLEQGINYIDDSTVYLVLYAPYKNYAYVLGDFNNWQPDVDYFMNYDPAKQVYWLKISGLIPGKEVGYQYLVNGDLRVADPFSPIMLHEWDDSYIPSTTYPNLKPYPKNKTTGWVTVMEPGSTPYSWTKVNFTRPKKEQLVIYELLIRDYTKAQTFKSIQDTLDYLKRLGINAIEFMPLAEFEGNISWGYNPASHMALDKYYGSRNAFKSLVDACHQKGIAVIMDVVYNHAFSSAPICQLYWDAVNFRPSSNSPYANITAKHPFNVGYDLNHSTSATKYYTKRTLEYWLKEFHVDGFRFDLSKGLTQTDYGTDVSAWGRYDAARINTLDDYHKHIQSISPGAYTILEHFADNDEEQELSKRGMMTWGNAVHNATEAAMGYSSTSDFGWLVDYSKRGMQPNSLVGYASSHDEERMAYKSKMYGNSSGNYSTKTEEIYLKRNALTYAFVHLVPGPKMIWQFDELGYDYSINWCKDGTVSDACRLVEKPARWDYWTGISDRPDLYYQHAMFNHLKTNYSDVYAPTSYSFSSGGSFKRLLLNGSEFQTLVVGNFDVVSSVKSPVFSSTGWWYNYLTGDSIQVNDVNVGLNFAAGDYRIYTSKKVMNPFLVKKVNSIGTLNSGGLQLYPVPASEVLMLKWDLNSAAFSNSFDFNSLKIEISDVTGKTIKSGNLNENTWVQKESNHLKLDVSTLNTGIYFIRVQSGQNTYKTKFTLSK